MVYAVSIGTGRVRCAVFVIGVIFLLDVTCENYTEKYPWETFQSRQNRLISFHTLDQGDIELELEFKVPFLSIPIKKTVSGTSGSLANINLGSIALTGAIVFGAIVAVPALFALINKKDELLGIKPAVAMPTDGDDDATTFMKMNDVADANTTNDKRNKRYDASSQLWHLLSNLDESVSHVGSAACMQRAVCWSVRSSSSRMAAGQAASLDKIIDGLATNEWVQYFAQNSMFEHAIKHGLRKSNCAKVYGQCKLSQNIVSLLAKQFSAMINT